MSLAARSRHRWSSLHSRACSSPFGVAVNHLSIPSQYLGCKTPGAAIWPGNGLGEHLHRARVVGAEVGLDRHVEVAERLDVVRERQRAGVDRAQAAVGRESLDRVLGGAVVAGEEDV